MFLNKVVILTFVGFFAGCQAFSRVEPEIPQVKVITETIKLEIYQPPMPPPIQLEDIYWYVITKKNLEEKITEIEKLLGPDDFVVYGITPQSYENMAYNLQELRRYIRQQTEIINYYRQETAVGDNASWSEKTKDIQSTQLEAISDSIADPAEVPKKPWYMRLF